MFTTPHTPNASDEADVTLPGSPFTMSLNTIGAGIMSMPNARKYVNE